MDRKERLIKVANELYNQYAQSPVDRAVVKNMAVKGHKQKTRQGLTPAQYKTKEYVEKNNIASTNARA